MCVWTISRNWAIYLPCGSFLYRFLWIHHLFIFIYFSFFASFAPSVGHSMRNKSFYSFHFIWSSFHFTNHLYTHIFHHMIQSICLLFSLHLLNREWIRLRACIFPFFVFQFSRCAPPSSSPLPVARSFFQVGISPSHSHPTRPQCFQLVR